MKKILLAALVVVVILILIPVSLFIGAFSGNSQIVDRARYQNFVTTVKDGFVSSFVLDAGNGQVVLIDAGKDTNAASILAALKESGKTSSDVAAIFLTHGHGDHISGVKAFPRAKVFALADDVPLVEGKVKSSGPMTHAFPPNKLGVKVSDPLADGQVVSIGKLSIKTIAVPGHTAGSAAFLVGGAVFLGDSVGANPKGELTPAVYIFSDSRKKNVESLKALAAKLKPMEKEIAVLLPAHTGPLTGLKPLLDFAAK